MGAEGLRWGSASLRRDLLQNRRAGTGRTPCQLAAEATAGRAGLLSSLTDSELLARDTKWMGWREEETGSHGNRAQII